MRVVLNVRLSSTSFTFQCSWLRAVATMPNMYLDHVDLYAGLQGESTVAASNKLRTLQQPQLFIAVFLYLAQ